MLCGMTHLSTPLVPTLGEWWRNSDDVTVMSCTLSLSLFPRALAPHPLPVTEQFYLCSLASAHVCERVHVLSRLASAACVPVSAVLIGLTGPESERARRETLHPSHTALWRSKKKNKKNSECVRKMTELVIGCLGKGTD